MNIQYTAEQFLNIIKAYNQSVWPMQILLNAMAVLAVYLTWVKKSYTGQYNAWLLTFLWIWTGTVYHILFFSQINKAAFIFGAMFVVQGLLFAYLGIIRKRLKFQVKRDVYGIIGFVFIIYALILYPALGRVFGHNYPEVPTFGAPCPMVIFTFGSLLWARQPVPRLLLLIPFSWSVLGLNAAVSFSMKEDFGLFAAGLLGFTMLIIRDWLRVSRIRRRLMKLDGSIS